MAITSFCVQFKDLIMLQVTLTDYTVIYCKSLGEALEKAYKLGQNIRFID